MNVFTSTVMWHVNLTIVFMKNAPVLTTMAIMTTLFYQLAMMMAFLMPLKVVMLLSSEDVPKFFPKVLFDIDRNTLIISLVVLSIAAFIASMIFNYIAKKATEIGVQKLLTNTQKIIIFENQDNIASNSYTKLTDALAGLFFAIITISTLLVFYQDVAMLITGFLLFSYLIVHTLYVSNTQIEVLINEKTQSLSNSISNICFLLIFLYIVVDFLYLSPPDFIVALATIIVGRLMLVRLSFATSSLFSLKRDENKINALFFHHQAFIPTDKKQNKTAWDLLIHDPTLNWVKPVLVDAIQQDFEKSEISTQWLQTRLKDIIVLRAKLTNKRRSFLIKIFEDKLNSQALHESSLMIQSDIQALPCPPFLLATTVSNYHCHVFEITNHEYLSPREAFIKSNQINENLLQLSPSEELIERYKRSKAFIWERIDISMTDRLRLVISKEDHPILDKFIIAMQEIKTLLSALPLSFVNHKMNNTSLMQNSENQTVSFHWPLWIVEPTGFGIAMSTEDKSNMIELIQTAGGSRTILKQFPIESYELVALIAAFEENYHQQQYGNAIEFCQLILDKLATLNSVPYTNKKSF